MNGIAGPVHVDAWNFTDTEKTVHPEDLPKMRDLAGRVEGTRWAWYECQDLCGSHAGERLYLATGPAMTCKAPPPFFPGQQVWQRMSVFMGYVDLETGICKPKEADDDSGA